MRYFQVRLEGENFFVELDGKRSLMGFITTRWVKAGNYEEAEFKAVDLIKNDQHLQTITKDISNAEPKPMIYLNDICNISLFTYFLRKLGRGYAFYPMESTLGSE